MLRVLTAVLVLLWMSVGPVAARTLDQPPAYIKKEGNFVTYPARAFSALCTVVGGVIALPADLVALPIGFAAGDPLGYGLLPSAVVGNGLGEAGYHVGGAIPYAIKKTFYDGPLYVAHAIKGDALSGLVAHVEPAPDFGPTDLQYLDSTPGDDRVAVQNVREYSLALPPPRQPTSLMLKRQLSPFKLPPTASAPVAPVTPPAAAPAQPAAAAPAPAAPVETAAAPAPVGLPPPAPRAVPAQKPEPQPAAEESVAPQEPVERPSLRKKKRKFSERFGF